MGLRHLTAEGPPSIMGLHHLTTQDPPSIRGPLPHCTGASINLGPHRLIAQVPPSIRGLHHLTAQEPPSIRGPTTSLHRGLHLCKSGPGCTTIHLIYRWNNGNIFWADMCILRRVPGEEEGGGRGERPCVS